MMPFPFSNVAGGDHFPDQIIAGPLASLDDFSHAAVRIHIGCAM